MKLLTKILILLTFWTNSSFAEENDTLLVVTGESVRDYWVIKKIKRPYYPRVAALDGVEGCAAIGFVIESNGSTTNHRPLAAYPSDIFLRPSLDATKKWRYTPSEANLLKQPVFTIQVITFALGKDLAETKTKDQKFEDICKSAANKSLNSDAGKAGAG